MVGCEAVKFKPMALYDHYEEPPPESTLPQIIYEDAVGTMWSSLESCGKFEVTKDVAYSGNSSIRISWDKGKGCDWIGFGNSFSNWGAADMSEARTHKALSFFARTQTKTAGGIPIVACLEDFGGGGSYYFLDAKKYLNGLYLDTTWKQMIIPLWDFPVNEEEVDIYSIKQMKFQLEGAGSYYLDDIKIIEYSREEHAQMRADVEAMKPKGSPNQVVYREGKFLDDVWGYENNSCQTLEERDGNGKMIYWKYNADGCDWAKWGINWNDWYQANFRGICENSTLSFKYKTASTCQFKVFLDDYEYHGTEIFSSKTAVPEWKEVRLPMKEWKLKEKGFALDQIKQFRFEGVGNGEVYLDEIKITGS